MKLDHVCDPKEANGGVHLGFINFQFESTIPADAASAPSQTCRNRIIRIIKSLFLVIFQTREFSETLGVFWRSSKSR